MVTDYAVKKAIRVIDKIDFMLTPPQTASSVRFSTAGALT
ncbi:hypothetical protein Xsze_04256 [Xenorhabdus szentirmaii DSM 16338]|nr:hypothetical protein Xsze_04256 [Xenorhabdus szentirmaii DSM 16338]